eukprot:5901413-Amphidinium_carterae.3
MQWARSDASMQLRRPVHECESFSETFLPARQQRRVLALQNWPFRVARHEQVLAVMSCYLEL